MNEYGDGDWVVALVLYDGSILLVPIRTWTLPFLICLRVAPQVATAALLTAIKTTTEGGRR